MDLKSFGEPDFDPKQWINRAWKTSKEKESKEVFVGNTLGKLQLYMQQLNNGLEDTTAQLVSGLPRVLSETQALQQDGVALRHKLHGLQSQVCAVEEATGQSIRSLQRIDCLKGKLENAASSLREADKWVQLATALEDKLEAGVPTHGPQLAELTQQIQAMTNSLEVLSDAPDYNEKKQQLEGLYNRLEAALSPAVVDSFTNHNTESARAAALTFSHMRRAASLRGYWRRCEATRLAAAWLRLLEPEGRAAGVLRELHGSMLRHAGHQLEWCTEVFGCDLVLPDLVQLYTELLQSLQPSPSDVVTAGLKQPESPADALESLSDVRAACRHFVDGFVAVIEGVRGRRDAAGITSASLTQLGRAVYAPLRTQLPRYAELQAQALAIQLNSINAGQEDALERARALLVGAERSSGWLLAALAAGQKLAGPACVPHLLGAFESFLSLHCSRIRANRRQLEAALNAARATPGPSTERLWLMFPPALLLLCTAGVLLDAARALQTAVADALLVDSAKPSKPPLHDDEALLLEPDTARQLELQRSSAAPLEQSTGDLRRVCRDLRGTALQVVFEPVAGLLDKLPEMDMWSENEAGDADLPDFSFSPQEYITQIGQYLMTLPQHLEPFLAEQRHGASLATALVAAGDQLGTDGGQVVGGADLAWYFLNEICSSTCELYCDKILSVRYMDAMGSRRYATDIAYVCSIVEELGSPSAAALRKLEKLLRASPSSFGEAAEGVSARVAATVKHLRGFGNQ